jgi:hypothetical protein
MAVAQADAEGADRHDLVLGQVDVLRDEAADGRRMQGRWVEGGRRARQGLQAAGSAARTSSKSPRTTCKSAARLRR